MLFMVECFLDFFHPKLFLLKSVRPFSTAASLVSPGCVVGGCFRDDFILNHFYLGAVVGKPLLLPYVWVTLVLRRLDVVLADRFTFVDSGPVLHGGPSLECVSVMFAWFVSDMWI